MRQDQTTRNAERRTPGAVERAKVRRLTAEGQRLRACDAARDHLAQPGAEQATTVARRTASTWR